MTVEQLEEYYWQCERKARDKVDEWQRDRDVLQGEVQRLLPVLRVPSGKRRRAPRPPERSGDGEKH
jgi:hypothetical protein